MASEPLAAGGKATPAKRPAAKRAAKGTAKRTAAKRAAKAAPKVKPADVTAISPPEPSLKAVVKSGDHRASLEAMAARLADDWELAPVTIRPQIAGRLQAVLAALAALPAEQAKSKVDELAERRRDRIAAAQTRAAAEGVGRQPRQ